MIAFFFSLTALGAVAGGALLAFTIFGSQSAPQQAAGAAMALGLAVIPYIFSRCIQIAISEGNRRDENQRLLDRLDALTKAVSASGRPEN
ncbi:hypothetical protein [Variovorax paradoxus]|uniref:Uncharacterized protein n=1 Tax=Variovorax paradoxus TaxID=34073 RepID=A0A679JIJ2_VARPD|nr:hypothetical protein VVAX_03577 [Variovorax paradoxus]